MAGLLRIAVVCTVINSGFCGLAHAQETPSWVEESEQVPTAQPAPPPAVVPQHPPNPERQKDQRDEKDQRDQEAEFRLAQLRAILAAHAAEDREVRTVTTVVSTGLTLATVPFGVYMLDRGGTGGGIFTLVMGGLSGISALTSVFVKGPFESLEDYLDHLPEETSAERKLAAMDAEWSKRIRSVRTERHLIGGAFAGLGVLFVVSGIGMTLTPPQPDKTPIEHYGSAGIVLGFGASLLSGGMAVLITTDRREAVYDTFRAGNRATLRGDSAATRVTLAPLVGGLGLLATGKF